MDLRFLGRRGVTSAQVADAAGVTRQTAWRWIDGGADCDSLRVLARLQAHGIVTAADLRAAGLTLPLPVPATPPADEPVAEVDPGDVAL